MAANGVTVYAVWALDNNGPHDPTDPEVTPSEPGDPDATPDYYEYGILYDGNGATSGDVPVDGALYPVNGSVTVMGNPGGLVRDGAVFLGWSLTEQAPDRERGGRAGGGHPDRGRDRDDGGKRRDGVRGVGAGQQRPARPDGSGSDALRTGRPGCDAGLL